MSDNKLMLKEVGVAVGALLSPPRPMPPGTWMILMSRGPTLAGAKHPEHMSVEGVGSLRPLLPPRLPFPVIAEI